MSPGADPSFSTLLTASLHVVCPPAALHGRDCRKDAKAQRPDFWGCRLLRTTSTPPARAQGVFLGLIFKGSRGGQGARVCLGCELPSVPLTRIWRMYDVAACAWARARPRELRASSAG